MANNGNVLVVRSGFANVVQQICGITAPGVGSGQVYRAPIGCAVIIPGTQNGLRVTGINASIDLSSSEVEYVALRSFIVSLPGGPANIQGIIDQLPLALGALNAQTDGGGDVLTLCPAINDITELQFNDGGAPAGDFTPLAGGNSNSLTCMFDELNEDTTSSPTRQYFGERGIVVPPNTSVAGIFLAMRKLTPGATATTPFSYGQTVRGALYGYEASAEQAASGGQEFTPRRFGSVAVPGAKP